MQNQTQVKNDHAVSYTGEEESHAGVEDSHKGENETQLVGNY